MKNMNEAEKEKALHYIDTLLEVAREPFLILDNKIQVIRASEAFYQTFEVNPKETEGAYFYNLGNKQWDIPKLRELLEGILPEKKVIKNYEVDHNFPVIGRRIMLLNARQVDNVQLIILAFEDVTEKRLTEKKAEDYTKQLEIEVDKRTQALDTRVEELERLTKVMVGRELKMTELKKEIARLKQLKNLANNNRHLPS